MMIVIHSGSTNYDIVNYISRYWNISSMVSKNIRNSRLDGMNMDLSQYIVEQLMRMDNTRLLGLYHSGKLLSFIHRMILNQRNYYRSFYNLSKVNNIVLIHLSNRNSDAVKFQKEIAATTGKNVYIADKGMVIEFNKSAI